MTKRGKTLFVMMCVVIGCLSIALSYVYSTAGQDMEQTSQPASIFGKRDRTSVPATTPPEATSPPGSVR